MFCRYCGAAVAGAAAPRRLERLPADGKIAGVCAGLSAYFDVDVTLVRLVWIILSIVPGAIIGGIVAYAAAWFLMPVAAASVRPPSLKPRLVRSATNRQLAGVCGGLAEYFGIDPTVVRIAAVILAIYPGAIVCGLLAYAVAWFIIPDAPASPLQPLPSTV
jgi:phage shock protein PspC (stress-responsive transcriptional regulator)